MPLRSDRRQFLKYLGAGLSSVVVSNRLGPIAEARGLMPFQAAAAAADSAFLTFDQIRPTDVDDLVLPAEYRAQVVIAYGDRFTPAGERFGFNADYTAFIPQDDDPAEGLLFVNHEFHGSATNYYGQAFARVAGGVPNVEDMKFDVGVSIVHIRQDSAGQWTVLASDLNRRLTAESLAVASGPALQGLPNVGGTLANCSGCRTLWNTVLTCEENFQDSVPENLVTDGRGTIGGFFRKDGTHFGWVVEIDPHDPSAIPVKHTSLGRFRHENVALRTRPGDVVIAYMGDDRTNGHVYKFVSDARFIPGSAANRMIFERGRLFSARFNADGSGQWVELALDTELNPHPGTDRPAIPSGARRLRDVYGTQANILIDAYRASNLIGSAPAARPEDVEVHPLDNSVYVAFASNATTPDSLFTNIYGEIVRIVEASEDGTGTGFTWQRWKAGGPNDAAMAGHVFAAPDNLSFDKAGNLWVISDINTGSLNAQAEYSAFKNNGMFYVPTSGPNRGVAFQFASGPCECELTGSSWTPDEQTLFLSVQHPGELNGTRTSAAMSPRGSNWPHRAHGAPLPGVVAIQRR